MTRITNFLSNHKVAVICSVLVFLALAIGLCLVYSLYFRAEPTDVEQPAEELIVEPEIELEEEEEGSIFKNVLIGFCVLVGVVVFGSFAWKYGKSQTSKANREELKSLLAAMKERALASKLDIMVSSFDAYEVTISGQPSVNLVKHPGFSECDFQWAVYKHFFAHQSGPCPFLLFKRPSDNNGATLKHFRIDTSDQANNPLLTDHEVAFLVGELKAVLANQKDPVLADFKFRQTIISELDKHVDKLHEQVKAKYQHDAANLTGIQQINAAEFDVLNVRTSLSLTYMDKVVHYQNYQYGNMDKYCMAYIAFGFAIEDRIILVRQSGDMDLRVIKVEKECANISTELAEQLNIQFQRGDYIFGEQAGY